jgi:uncharacterized protein YggE
MSRLERYRKTKRALAAAKKALKEAQKYAKKLELDLNRVEKIITKHPVFDPVYGVKCKDTS